MMENKPSNAWPLVWILLVIGVVWMAGLRILEWKIQGGNWGNYWGVDEEGWAGMWATIISASVAATVAIYVLRRQSDTQAAIAQADRHHQAEEARIARDIEATLRLQQDLDDFLMGADALAELLDGYMQGEQAEHLRHPSVDVRLRTLLMSMQRWGANSGLESYEYRAIIYVMRLEAIHYLVIDNNQQCHLHADFAGHLRQMVGELVLHLATPGDQKFSVMKKHVDYFDAEQWPKVQQIKKQYGDAVMTGFTSG